MSGLGGLVHDLERDRVMALPVATHYYGVTRREIVAEGLNLITMRMQLVARQMRAERVTLLVNDSIMSAPPSANVLRHLAGTVAIRLLIDAPAERFENTADRALARLVPDGLWLYDNPDPAAGGTPGSAVEYDAGSYSAQQIQEKMLAFEPYKYQFWGGVSRARAHFIARQAKLGGVHCAVLEVPWWEPPPEDYYQYRLRYTFDGPVATEQKR